MPAHAYPVDSGASWPLLSGGRRAEPGRLHGSTDVANRLCRLQRTVPEILRLEFMLESKPERNGMQTCNRQDHKPVDAMEPNRTLVPSERQGGRGAACRMP